MHLDDHIKSQVVLALGIGGFGPDVTVGDGKLWQASAEWLRRYGDCLTAKDNQDADLRPKAPVVAEDLHSELEQHDQRLRSFATQQGLPSANLCRWPAGAPFGLLLTHDIDQIFDRELFRVLADINHVRRRLLSGEPGNAPLACRRIARAVFNPKRTLSDFETILEIERRHGFRSTFFLLHDRYWARQGARFSFADPEIQEIGRMALRAGCELGVHGGYYRFNQAAMYRESKEAVKKTFGVEPVGIRNHLLRFTYPETWRAQAEAGFEYDATYGYRSVPGPRAGLAFPFFPAVPLPTGDHKPRTSVLGPPSSDTLNPQLSTLNLLELPLTVMDTSIFRYLRLQGEAALEFTWKLVARLASQGALVSLLWHNNFFNEPEYWDWQMVYEKLLERLAALKPWCATGAEINNWWRRRARVTMTSERQPGFVRWRFQIPEAMEGLTIRVRAASPLKNLTVVGAPATVAEETGGVRIVFPQLSGASECVLRAEFPCA